MSTTGWLSRLVRFTFSALRIYWQKVLFAILGSLISLAKSSVHKRSRRSRRRAKKWAPSNKLLALVEEDPKLIIRELAPVLDCAHNTVFRHLHFLGKVSKLGQWVPHRLTEKNKKDRMKIAQQLLNGLHEGDIKLDEIVTSDEKWVLYANEWTDKGETPSATVKPGLHPLKVMLCVGWDSEGIIHWELMPKCQTINADVYCEQLDRVHKALNEKRANRKKTTFLHENATPHKAKKIKKKLEKLGWTILPHPPYSPDYKPTDYKLFRSLQNALRGKEFKSVEQICVFIEDFFASKPSGFFVRAYTELHHRWEELVEYEGDYLPE